MAEKVCPVVFRVTDAGAELLAFEHPTAGNQFVKGGIKDGELPTQAAVRELREESGITASSSIIDLGQAWIQEQAAVWHFFALECDDLPDRWEHQTEDDHGHLFSFFWHPVDHDLDEKWHPQFREALQILRLALPR